MDFWLTSPDFFYTVYQLILSDVFSLIFNTMPITPCLHQLSFSLFLSSQYQLFKSSTIQVLFYLLHFFNNWTDGTHSRNIRTEDFPMYFHNSKSPILFWPKKKSPIYTPCSISLYFFSIFHCLSCCKSIHNL